MPIAIYGTLWIIVLAFIGRFTGYAVRSISSSIVQVHPELEESARIAGYGWFRTFTRITLPLIRPSIVASWMLLFSIFITELSMVILLYTANTRTFSVLSFEMWNAGNFSQVASLSLLQLVVGVVVLQTVQASVATTRTSMHSLAACRSANLNSQPKSLTETRTMTETIGTNITRQLAEHAATLRYERCSLLSDRAHQTPHCGFRRHCRARGSRR